MQLNSALVDYKVKYERIVNRASKSTIFEILLRAQENAVKSMLCDVSPVNMNILLIGSKIKIS